jgi:hypothetical protein
LASAGEGGAPKKNSSQAADQQGSVFYSVAAFSLVADLIHLWVPPSSFADL